MPLKPSRPTDEVNPFRGHPLDRVGELQPHERQTVALIDAERRDLGRLGPAAKWMRELYRLTDLKPAVIAQVGWRCART
jgi:hypothetical protein